MCTLYLGLATSQNKACKTYVRVHALVRRRDGACKLVIQQNIYGLLCRAMTRYIRRSVRMSKRGIAKILYSDLVTHISSLEACRLASRPNFGIGLCLWPRAFGLGLASILLARPRKMSYPLCFYLVFFNFS